MNNEDKYITVAISPHYRGIGWEDDFAGITFDNSGALMKQYTIPKTKDLTMIKKQIHLNNLVLIKGDIGPAYVPDVDNSVLEEQIATLTQEKQVLTQEKQALTEEKQTLTQKNEALTQEKQALTQEKQNLTQENETLTQEKQALTEEKQNLTQENASLTEEKQTLTQANTTLTQEKQTLEETVQRLESENADLRAQLEEKDAEPASSEPEAQTMSTSEEDNTGDVYTEAEANELTITDIKAILDEKEIDYTSTALKSELVKLLVGQPK